jgi:hypothetical protein
MTFLSYGPGSPTDRCEFLTDQEVSQPPASWPEIQGFRHELLGTHWTTTNSGTQNWTTTAREPSLTPFGRPCPATAWSLFRTISAYRSHTTQSRGRNGLRRHRASWLVARLALLTTQLAEYLMIRRGRLDSVPVHPGLKQKLVAAKRRRLEPGYSESSQASRSASRFH